MDEEIYLPPRARVLILAVANIMHCEIGPLQGSINVFFSTGAKRDAGLQSSNQLA